MLPAGVNAKIYKKSWEVPRLFTLLREIGDVPEADWRRTFNLGIGMIVAVSAKEQAKAETLLRKAGFAPLRIGEVTAARSPKSKPQVLYA